MKLFIKNMVCNRCIMVVKNELENLNIPVDEVLLGEVILKQDIVHEALQKIGDKLASLGFELIDDKRSVLIDKIKTLLIEQVHYSNDEHLKVNLSDLLTSKIDKDYSYLSNLFSEVEGTTIEKYHIAQKIERVKELLVYDELNLSEIAIQLGYSSVAHLSSQFKKVTGLTPSHFKHIKENKRKPLDRL